MPHVRGSRCCAWQARPWRRKVQSCHLWHWHEGEGRAARDRAHSPVPRRPCLCLERLGPAAQLGELCVRPSAEQTAARGAIEQGGSRAGLANGSRLAAGTPRMLQLLPLRGDVGGNAFLQTCVPLLGEPPPASAGRARRPPHKAAELATRDEAERILDTVSRTCQVPLLRDRPAGGGAWSMARHSASSCGRGSSAGEMWSTARRRRTNWR